MKRRNRAISLLLATAMTLSMVLSGCGNSASDGGQNAGGAKSAQPDTAASAEAPAPADGTEAAWDTAVSYTHLDVYKRQEYREMVFACNPESYAEQNVYPLAANFEDFIRLILACGTVNPVEQIVWMSRDKFDEHIANEREILTGEQKAAVKMLQDGVGLLPMNDPFDYVKSIQKHFDYSKIQYSDEYYDVTGIENPKGESTPEKPLFEFDPVVIVVHKKDDEK